MTLDTLENSGHRGKRFAGVRVDLNAALNASLSWLDGENSVTIEAVKLKEIVSNGPLRATLLLPGKIALVQTISLPASAQKHLAGIVENKIRQLTPFEPKDVYFNYKHISSHNQDLSVKIVVAPKEACKAYLKAAREREISVNRLEVTGAEGINILPAIERDTGRSGASTNRLIKINGLLLAAFITIIFAGSGLRYAIASAQAAKAEAGVTEVLQARREVQRIATTSKDLQVLQTGAPDIAALLDALAAAIDETAWLDRVTINKENIEIQGYAANAADVLFAVDQLPEISEASFKSAISRDKKSGKERFQIRANLAAKS